MYRFDPENNQGKGSFRVYSDRIFNGIKSILEDQSGHFWLSLGNGGLIRFKPDAEMKEGAIVRFDQILGFSSMRYDAIVQTNNGDVWLGTSNGLYRFILNSQGKMEYYVHYSVEHGLLENQILSILEDEPGSLWIGTPAGLCHLNLQKDSLGEEVTHFTTDHGLSHNRIWSITQDKVGNIWCITPNGLNRVRKSGVPWRKDLGRK